MSDVSGGPQSKLRESVSAMMDGEADELELRRVLASAELSEVRTAWRDFHVQRDILAGADVRFAHLDISSSVLLAISDETVPAVAAGQRWWRPLASVAVAASVASVVVLGARSFNPGVNDSAIAQSQAVSAASLFPSFSAPASANFGNVAVGAVMLSAPTMAQPVAFDSEQVARQRLRQMLLQRMERAASTNASGGVSFTKVSDLSSE